MLEVEVVLQVDQEHLEDQQVQEVVVLEEHVLEVEVLVQQIQEAVVELLVIPLHRQQAQVVQE
jgi:hypothetical protein